MSEIKIGEILLAQRLITTQQLEDALARQKSLSPPPVLGKLLVRLGYVQEAKLQQILDKFEKRRSFAAVLLTHNYLSPEDLDVALEMSGNELLPLDRVLLNLDFISEENLAKAIATYSDQPFAHLDKRKINVKTGLANAIIAFSAPPHKMVPITIEGKTITIAMNRPMPHKELLRLEDHIKLKVITIIAPENGVMKTQKNFFPLVGSGTVAEKDLEIHDNLMTMIADESDETDAEQDAQQVTERDSLLVKLVNKIIYDACQLKASDIHIEHLPSTRILTMISFLPG
jgi:hypothetical protein